MQTYKLGLFLALVLPACSGSAQDCRSTGFSEESVCGATFSELIPSAPKFKGKLVELRGYYAVHSVSGADKKFLFMSKEAEFSADYGAAVELGSLSTDIPKDRISIFDEVLNQPNRPLRVVGRFNSEPRHLPNGRSVLGLLEPLVGASAIVPPPRKSPPPEEANKP